MRLRETGYEIKIEKNDIKPFEEKVLFSGMCDIVMPMQFSNVGEQKIITYNCSGYAALRDMQLVNTKEIFEVLEKTLLTLNKTIEFFILPEKVTLNKDTVFYNLKKKNIRIAYVPTNDGSLYEHLNDFIDELAEDAKEETVEYLKSVKNDLHLYNRNLKELAGFVSEQRKRIYKCGVK